MENKPKFQLSDVEIHSLGLVGKGAIGEDFFLIKSFGENSMPVENENPEITQETIGKSLLETIGLSRVESWIKEAITKAASKKAMPMETEDEEDETEEDEMMMSGKKKVKKDMALTTEDIMKSDEFKAAMQKFQEQQTALLEKSLESQKDELQKKFDADKAELEKSLNAAKSEVEKANQQAVQFANAAQAENDKRVLSEFVTKAQAEFAALPTKADELGKLFFDLAKWDQAELVELKKSDEKAESPNRLSYVENILKAASQAIVQSGLFNERGSSLVSKDSDDVVAKAQSLVDSGKAKDLKEAMLQLSKVDQATHISKMQRQTAKQ